MPEALSLELTAKRQRKRGDYAYHLDYRTRWSEGLAFETLCHN